MIKKVAFIGLGVMGFPMAGHLSSKNSNLEEKCISMQKNACIVFHLKKVILNKVGTTILKETINAVYPLLKIIIRVISKI